MVSCLLPDLAHTTAIAARLAALLQPGDCLALHGNLGAGKTTLIRGIIEHLCGATHVPSPTFTLVQTYTTPRGKLWHFDLYRLKHESELDELGWDDARSDIMLVEWPERAETRLPSNHCALHLEIIPPSARRLTITAPPSWQDRLATLHDA